jgi:hypothetical protein
MKIHTQSYKKLAGILLMGCIGAVSLSSCEKLIDNNPAKTDLLDKEVFKDSTTVKPAILGMYSSLVANQTFSLNYSVFPGMSSDELQFAGNTYDAFINNALLPIQNNIDPLWANPYGVIYQANSIIEGIASGSNMSEAFKTRSVAEARFMRAFCHFYLANFFGDVPLITSTDVQTNKLSPRIGSAAVYEQIIQDLIFAQANLPDNYSISGGERVRANKWAATALLARVYLYTRNWSDAEKQASMLLDNNSLFGMPRNLTEVFAPSSKEAIWQLYNTNNGVTEYATQVIPNPTSPIPTFVLTDVLKNAFETGDIRKVSWTATIDYQGVAYTYPTKYKSRVQNANEEYLTVFRLAEQFLIRAEARAQQNNISGAKADIFAVRDRAHLGVTPANDRDALLLAIEQERRVELNNEWGHRWFDLRRTGRINTVLGAVKPAWKSDAALYPVPQIQRNNNPSLSQNLGYH